MCGMDVDLEDEGEEEKERVVMLPPPAAHSGAEAWRTRRGLVESLFWGVGLVLWNTAVAVVCLLILALVFSVTLLPPILLLCGGFNCHSRVMNSSMPLCRYLDDNISAALIILGFVMVPPLVVVAVAAFCTMLRWFHLLQLFQPMARACYRGGGWDRCVRAWV